MQRGALCLTVLDISAAALDRAAARLGSRRTEVSWIEADVTSEWRVPVVDIWHDRAVFHFLTGPAERAVYRERVLKGLRQGGSLVVATFAPDGPPKCSGLPTERYSPESLNQELGSRFQLKDAIHERHQTPSGNAQEFWYSRFELV